MGNSHTQLKQPSKNLPEPNLSSAKPCGVVLAGGQSSRLGQDKRFLLIADKTLLEHSAGLLTPLCASVCISCREDLPELPWPQIHDQFPRVGPAGGIATALRIFKRPILVLACDLPLMRGIFLKKLIEAHQHKPAQAVVTLWEHAETHRPEPLVALYEPAALPFLEAGFAQKCYALTRLFPPPLRHSLLYPADEKAFSNINTPHDLLHTARLCRNFSV